MLEPDSSNSFLIDGLGSGFNRAVAARAIDRSFGVVFLPSARRLTLDLDQLLGPTLQARWYDPSLGQLFGVAGSPFAARGRRVFAPVPRREGVDGGDWVLVLQSKT